MKIDVDELRCDLLDEAGTAMVSGFPAAVLDVSDIEDMSPEELLERAEREGVDIERYEVDD